MSKAKMIGQIKPYTPNRKADMRRGKQYRRDREYTGRYEEVMEAKAEAKRMREKEEMGC